MRGAWGRISLGAFALLAWVGCVSNEPGSASTAHVVIEQAPVDAIRDELVRVFEDDHFTVERKSSTRLEFSRPATQRDIVMFGEFGSGEITMHVEISIKPHGSYAHLVQADVEAEYAEGGSRSVGMIGSRPYQSLLERAAANLVTSRSP